jgi:branched-chain amino acid transport system ATP-binding protein
MVLETEDLTKEFGALAAVDRVNLAVEENAVHSIIGPNGAGKTTLFNLLTGTLNPTDGRIFLHGEDITDVPIYERPYLGIARSYQITNVFDSMTVFENIQTAVALFQRNYYDTVRRLDAQDEVTAKVESILDQVGLRSKQTMRAESLPHGNKRHLEIGLALAAEPDLLLLDEPTAGMSWREAQETSELVDRLSADATILFIEHNIEYVMEVSDVITVLERGAVIAEGDPASIRNDETVQRTYLQGEHA